MVNSIKKKMVIPHLTIKGGLLEIISVISCGSLLSLFALGTSVDGMV
jgi:hypothetical protein